jgi:ribosome biogenesis GTPase
VAAVKGDLRPILCFNKWDLLESAAARDESAAASGGAADETTAPDDAVAEFEALGYCCLKTSATTGLGMERLREELRGSVTVLSGQSGVGKSTLLNWLQPGLGLATQAVSEENQKGKHTTSIARLFRLDFGGYVVDTPGIRQFDLWNVEPGELEACFVEFVRHVPDCAFRDCHHTEEAGCAVRAAVEEGHISARRYGSYLKMLGELARG